MTARFAFEHAEAVLDAFAYHRRDVPEAFLDAYARFKAQILVEARVDHAYLDPETARARAWESAEVAFHGYAGGALVYAVSDLWIVLPEPLHPAFHEAIRAAFRLATAYTPRGLRRMYAARYRRGPLPVGHVPHRRCVATPRWPVSALRLEDVQGETEADLEALRAVWRDHGAPKPPPRPGGHLRRV